MKTDHRYLQNAVTPASQRGVALVFGMIVLLILTLIGITAIRGTTQQGKMTVASQQQAESFEAAESAIHLVMSQLSGDDAGAAIASTDILTTAISNGLYPQGSPIAAAPSVPTNAVTVTPVTNDAKISSTAKIYATGIKPALGSSVKFAYYELYIDATATEPGTGASVRNIQGIGYLFRKQAGT